VSSTLETLFRVGAVGRLEDAELLELFLRRDKAGEAAFTILVQRHGPMVLRACQGVLRDPNDVEDAFQTTFLVLVRRAHTVQKLNSVGSWLFGVALRVSRRARVDTARRVARERKRAEYAVLPSWQLDHESGAWADDYQELFEEIDRLPETFRQPVVLCYLEGLSTEQAALRLGCARGTILSRLARARDRLRQRLERSGVAPSLALGPSLAQLARARPVVPRSLVEAAVAAALAFARLHAGRGIALGLAPSLLALWTLGIAAVLGSVLLLFMRSPPDRARAGLPVRHVRLVPTLGTAGRLDAAFGDRGIVVVDHPHGALTKLPSAVAIQPDGKAVVALSTGPSPNSPSQLYIARYGTDGDLDETFGSAGYALAGFVPEGAIGLGSTRPRVVVQPDGKILLASSTPIPRDGHYGLAFARFCPDGTPDLLFGNQGVVRLPLDAEVSPTPSGPPTATSVLTGLALQPDGMIVAGAITCTAGEVFGLVRLRADGSLDPSFGNRGRVLTRFPTTFEPPSWAHAFDLAISRDGRIAMAGSCYVDRLHCDVAVAMYDSHGRLDPAFGTCGVATIDFGTAAARRWRSIRPHGGNTDERARAVAFTSQGSLLVAGGVTGRRSFLARLDRRGRFDPGFGDHGVVFSEAGGSAEVEALAVQDDGKILVGGRVRSWPYGNSLLARLEHDGTPDPTFGWGGQVVTDHGQSGNVESLALAPDASIVTVGHADSGVFDSPTSIVLMRHRGR
jgi:RNA polymerase sigma factor (sigma-70 family)